jgi:hypothetical protein
MLLKGQEAASNPFWKSMGNKPSITEGSGEGGLLLVAECLEGKGLNRS